MSKDSVKNNDKTLTGREERLSREAEALRNNLRRRKQQKRNRSDHSQSLDAISKKDHPVSE